MRRTMVALGILGLVYALARPAAAQTVLFKADFSAADLTTIFKGVGGFYMQGVGDAVRADSTLVPFMVRDGVLTSSAPGSTSGSDGTSGTNDPPGVRYLLLTGLDTWPADVAIQSEITIDSQNTGGVALVLRARAKTKVTDTDSWYEFRYTTGNSPTPNDEEVDSKVPDAGTNPNVRIMKVLNGKWSILAEYPGNQTSDIPAINAAGSSNSQGAVFRFTAKADVLTGLISLDRGQTFKQFLQVKDSDLKTGRVGISHFDYNPIFHSLQVEAQ